MEFIRTEDEDRFQVHAPLAAPVFAADGAHGAQAPAVFVVQALLAVVVPDA